MSARRACLACRARKVKCISGPTPRCQRCVTLEFNDCVYEPVKKRGVGKTLHMGEACKRCRSRKSKCDAKRPCTRCVEGKVASGCEYEIVGPTSSLLDQPYFLIWNEPDPPASKTLSRGRRTVEDAALGSPTNTNIATLAQSALGTVPSALALVHRIGHNSPPSPVSADPPLRVVNEVGTRRSPPVMLPLPRMSTRIPPEPHISLLFFGAERFQLSSAALAELDMKFRINALCRLNKLGIRFTSEKQRAVFGGDTSGTIIHPFFIHSARTLGMYFCEGMANSPAMVRLHAKHVQMTLECLVEIFEGHDWELRAQAALWVTSASITLLLDNHALLYMQRSCEAVNTAGLRFIPTYGRPPEFSEELHEKLSVLSQIIYFENFLFLTHSGGEPTMATGIEGQFRYQLPEVYPLLFRICPLAMRTKTILLVRDTVVLLAHRPADGARMGIWRQSCDQLVAMLVDYSQDLLSDLRRFQELGNKVGAEIIRDCCVNCFAHLAILCETLREMEPFSPAGVEALCDSSLVRLSELAQDACREEYTRHDLLLRMSWEKALGVFDARLANIPLEDSTKLQHCKKVVTKLHQDIVAKLPGASRPPLINVVLQMDGRVEGSRYPNFILPQGRQLYGI